MIDPLECPTCEDSDDTERVHVENHPERIEEVYVCSFCPTQYTVRYRAESKEIDDL